MSEDDFVENVATTISKNAEVKEYAVGAFPDKRNDERYKNDAIDQFCKSAIILSPGESLILQSYH